MWWRYHSLEFQTTSCRGIIILQSRVYCMFALHMADPLAVITIRRAKLPPDLCHPTVLQQPRDHGMHTFTHETYRYLSSLYKGCGELLTHRHSPHTRHRESHRLDDQATPPNNPPQVAGMYFHGQRPRTRECRSPGGVEA